MIGLPSIRRQCECKHCEYARRVHTIRDTGSVQELRSLIDELYEFYQNTDFDLSYWKSIADGSWPSAKDIALRIIEKWEEHPNRKAEIGGAE